MNLTSKQCKLLAVIEAMVYVLAGALALSLGCSVGWLGMVAAVVSLCLDWKTINWMAR